MPLKKLIALVAVAATLASSSFAQQQGWTGQANSRYGAAAPGGASPAAATQPQPLAQPASNPQAGGDLAPITPLGVDPPAQNQTSATPAAPSPGRASVTKGPSSLPNGAGQVMREYDIRPYTLRVTNKERPEQTLVDWVLRETGYEAWHGEPFGFLSASRDKLLVYHTPQMHAVVADIVDRFVNSQTASKAFSLRIATVRSPSWRAKALPLMTPISVQSPGMQGWIMPKENAAILMSMLTARGDYREHSASNQMVLNGHGVLLSTMRPRSYIKGVIRTDNTWPGFQPETGALEEGASMEFSPLLSLSGDSADAVIKIRIHQVEKMAKVKLDIPTTITGNQRMEVEVPQMTMANVHERFRWPADHVLLLSMGVVPPPTMEKGNPVLNMIPGVSGAPRADGLLMIEVRGTAIPSATPGAPVSTALRGPGSFSGRY